MPQVSRRFLKSTTQERIFSLFISSIVLSQTKEEAIRLIEDILTPTEKIMLAKRFSIAFMLLEGYDYDIIGETLKVSRSTIGTMALWLKTRGKGIREIKEKIKKNDKLKKIWDEIQEGILEILGNSPGINWQRSKRILHEFKEKKKQPF